MGGVDQLADRPHMIGEAKRNRRGGPERFVNAAEIVMRHIERDRRNVIV